MVKPYRRVAEWVIARVEEEEPIDEIDMTNVIAERLFELEEQSKFGLTTYFSDILETVLTELEDRFPHIDFTQVRKFLEDMGWL